MATPAKLPKPTEAEFTAQVLAFAKLHRWRTIHLRPARTAHGWRTAVQGDGEGFPDIQALRGKRQVVAELKIGKNKLTPDQEIWLAAFVAAGAEVYVWTEHSWDEIQRVLR